jgi:hypothetical protein
MHGELPESRDKPLDDVTFEEVEIYYRANTKHQPLTKSIDNASYNQTWHHLFSVPQLPVQLYVLASKLPLPELVSQVQLSHAAKLHSQTFHV